MRSEAQAADQDEPLGRHRGQACIDVEGGSATGGEYEVAALHRAREQESVKRGAGPAASFAEETAEEAALLFPSPTGPRCKTAGELVHRLAALAEVALQSGHDGLPRPPGRT